MNLYEGKPGKSYTVEALHLPLPATRRFEAIGIFEGTRIFVLNRKKTGAMMIRARGTRWAIGKEHAEGIAVKEYKDEDH